MRDGSRISELDLRWCMLSDDACAALADALVHCDVCTLLLFPSNTSVEGLSRLSDVGSVEYKGSGAVTAHSVTAYSDGDECYAAILPPLATDRLHRVRLQLEGANPHGGLWAQPHGALWGGDWVGSFGVCYELKQSEGTEYTGMIYSSDGLAFAKIGDIFVIEFDPFNGEAMSWRETRADVGPGKKSGLRLVRSPDEAAMHRECLAEAAKECWAEMDDEKPQPMGDWPSMKRRGYEFFFAVADIGYHSSTTMKILDCNHAELKINK